VIVKEFAPALFLNKYPSDALLVICVKVELKVKSATSVPSLLNTNLLAPV